VALLPPPHFLIVDENSDSRLLLAKALARTYPDAVLHETSDVGAACVLVRENPPTAIVLHRTYDYDGETLVALFRRLDRQVPVIMVSGYDRSERAKAAGADAFLNYDKWLMIGTVVGEVLARRAQGDAVTGAASADSNCSNQLAAART
jgi:DNA-binding response OmpR family regulator